MEVSAIKKWVWLASEPVEVEVLNNNKIRLLNNNSEFIWNGKIFDSEYEVISYFLEEAKHEKECYSVIHCYLKQQLLDFEINELSTLESYIIRLETMLKENEFISLSSIESSVIKSH